MTYCIPSTAHNDQCDIAVDRHGFHTAASSHIHDHKCGPHPTQKTTKVTSGSLLTLNLLSSTISSLPHYFLSPLSLPASAFTLRLFAHLLSPHPPSSPPLTIMVQQRMLHLCLPQLFFLLQTCWHRYSPLPCTFTHSTLTEVRPH